MKRAMTCLHCGKRWLTREKMPLYCPECHNSKIVTRFEYLRMRIKGVVPKIKPRRKNYRENKNY
jgi:Zn finger protein HypA/HybF involved in hydrogenase expression